MRDVQRSYDCIHMGKLYTCNVRNKGCPWGTPRRFMAAYPWASFTYVMCVTKSAHGGRPEHVQKIYDCIPAWATFTHVMCLIKSAHGGILEHVRSAYLWATLPIPMGNLHLCNGCDIDCPWGSQ